MSFSKPKVITLRLPIIVLIVTASLVATVHVALADPIVYWHSCGSGLPSDVQSLADVSLSTSTPDSPITLYVGTWGSGVYRSANHGATWITATVGLTLPMYVRSGLAVNPVTPTMLFAGDYYGGLSRAGVYRSTDGGDSWEVVLRDANI